MAEPEFCATCMRGFQDDENDGVPCTGCGALLCHECKDDIGRCAECEDMDAAMETLMEEDGAPHA